MIGIKTGVMKYRKSDGSYREFNSIVQESTAEQIEIIKDASNTQIGRIESVLQEAKDSGEFDGPKGDKGDTGLTPSLSIGTVSTLEPEQSASATITGTPEAPVLNLNIPRGNTGTISNAYGSIIPYSETDSRTIKQVVDALPTSIPVMTGATSSASGKAGIVPAPTSNQSGSFLRGDGMWSKEIYSPIIKGPINKARKQDTQTGQNSVALGGYDVTASGEYSFAEGTYTVASGSSSHAEGAYTVAEGSNSHAEGNNTFATGVNSHSEGLSTTASSDNQHVFGRYNVADDNGTFVEIVGNGGTSGYSNARTLDWDGNETIAGNLTINSADNPLVITNMFITPSESFWIPDHNETLRYDMAGITNKHYLLAWRARSTNGNDPSSNLTCETSDGYFTITNRGDTVPAKIQPIFVYLSSADAYKVQPT